MPAFLIESEARGIFMGDLLESIAAVAQSWLAPGPTFFRRYLDDAAQQTLAWEIAMTVLQERPCSAHLSRRGQDLSLLFGSAAGRRTD
jgi:hypothetical protein